MPMMGSATKLMAISPRTPVAARMFTSTPTLTIVATSGNTCSTVWFTTSSQRLSGRRTGSMATVVARADDEHQREARSSAA